MPTILVKVTIWRRTRGNRSKGIYFQMDLSACFVMSQRLSPEVQLAKGIGCTFTSYICLVQLKSPFSICSKTTQKHFMLLTPRDGVYLSLQEAQLCNTPRANKLHLWSITGHFQGNIYLFFFFHHAPINLSNISPRTWVLEGRNCFCCSSETSPLRSGICPELTWGLTQPHWSVSSLSWDRGRSLAQDLAQSWDQTKLFKASCSRVLKTYSSAFRENLLT